MHSMQSVFKLFLPAACCLLPALALAESSLFRIWPNHPDAPERPGPDGSAFRKEWDVVVDLRGIVANSRAVSAIRVTMPDGSDQVFKLKRFDDISGFELVGEFDFQPIPDAPDSAISYTWYGESASAQMTIAVWQGVMSATIGGIHEPLTLQRVDGQMRARALDRSRMPPELELAPIGVDIKSVKARVNSLGPVPSKAVVADVDALVVHTPAALAAVGGDPATLNALVAEAFLQLDSAMEVSGMTSTGVRNVLATQANLSIEVPYNEVPGNSCVGSSTTTCRWVGHRIWLRTDSSVAALRNTWSADIVVMIVADQATAGVAYTQRLNCGFTQDYENTAGCNVGSAYEPFAFAVVSSAYVTAGYTFAHEAGHQFGMEHQIGGGTPSYSWSYAKTSTDGIVQSLMGNQPNPFRRLQYSNPNVLFIGSSLPSGDSLRFNARTGECLAPLMSTFRSPSQPGYVFWDDFETRLIPIGGC